MKVLVVHISGLPLGFLGCYGNTWITTQPLARLAGEAVVFGETHAAMSWAPNTTVVR